MPTPDELAFAVACLDRLGAFERSLADDERPAAAAVGLRVSRGLGRQPEQPTLPRSACRAVMSVGLRPDAAAALEDMQALVGRYAREGRIDARIFAVLFAADCGLHERFPAAGPL